jgi:hypothetical protein
LPKNIYTKKIAYANIKLLTISQEAKMKNENGEMGISFVVMPIEILQNKELTASEKILYCYLLLFKKGVCYQSNEKLAEITGLDVSTIKRGLKKLSELQYVFIEFINNNSAARRIYIIYENPKKLVHLMKKGLLKAPADKPAEEPKIPQRAIEGKEEQPKSLNSPPLSPRPKRADFAEEKDYVDAVYAWNTQ